MLTEQVAHLRTAFREARRQRPFTIDAIVILPEHLHAVMTLPANDTNFSARWQRIKGLFTLLPADWGGDVAISDGSFGERVT